MKDYEEMAREVLERRDAYQASYSEKKKRQRIGVYGILVCLTLALTGTALYLYNGSMSSVNAVDLMEGVMARPVDGVTDLESGNIKMTDFAVRLLQSTREAAPSAEKNLLLSPLSVLSALAMTGNGAENETLAEIEAALGMKMGDLNQYLYSYYQSLPQWESKYELKPANSIWFTDSSNFSVNPDFLQTNADFYGADIYKAPFDKTTLKDINHWVNDRTDGMIRGILNDIPKESVMYLINALAFDAQWDSVYRQDQVRKDTFTLEDGTQQTVEFMRCSELQYLEDAKATGFLKYYLGEKYAFVALLPKEGVTVSEYVDSLDGTALHELLSASTETLVYTAMPKFQTEYSAEMTDILKALGITEAFDEETADFQSLGSARDPLGQPLNLYIGQVLHKTYIAVDERGTRAGAATAVAIGGGAGINNDIKEVYLNRPFVYMLIDCENKVPFFMGILESPK